MGTWNEKVVVVTGGSAGLGHRIVTHFAKAGATVYAVARSQEKLDYVISTNETWKRQVRGISADLTTAHDRQRMIDEVLSRETGIDVLVNNLGKSTRGKILETGADEFRELWELNFISLAECTRLAAPSIRTRRGSIVNIGSLASKSTKPFLGAYPTTKFAVAAYSQQLRWELAEDGVHVLLVCPGPIKRDDAGSRYDEVAGNVPAEARKPGGGVRLKGICPDFLAQQILRCCENRSPELVVPWRARILFAISQLSASWGDWLVKKFS